MKVRVSYTVSVDDTYRRAIRHHEGRSGLATRAEVRDFIRLHGENMDDEIMARLAQDEPDEEDEDGEDD